MIGFRTLVENVKIIRTFWVILKIKDFLYKRVSWIDLNVGETRICISLDTYYHILVELYHNFPGGEWGDGRVISSFKNSRHYVGINTHIKITNRIIKLRTVSCISYDNFNESPLIRMYNLKTPNLSPSFFPFILLFNESSSSRWNNTLFFVSIVKRK